MTKTYTITHRHSSKTYIVDEPHELFSWADNECSDDCTWWKETSARTLLDNLFCVAPEDNIDEELRAEASWIFDLANQHGWDNPLYRADYVTGNDGEYTPDPHRQN